MFEEGDEDGVGFGVWGVVWAVGHEDAVWVAEKIINGDGVLEGAPAGGWVFAAARDEEGAGGHEGVEFVEVEALGAEFWIEAAGGIVGGDEAALAPGAWVGAEVPGFPVVDAGASVVEDDASVGPGCAGEFVVEAGSEHGPFATVGVAGDADAGGVDFGA